MLGTLLILLSTCCLAIQNVTLKIIVAPHALLGLWDWGGWVTPGIGQSVLLLQLRTMIAVPLMMGVSRGLYPAAAAEIRQTFSLTKAPQGSQQYRYLAVVLGAGVAVFLALILLFTAISFLSTGVAVTLFFVHPAMTLLLAWLFLGERPSGARLALTSLIVLGLLLTMPTPHQLPLQDWLWGIGAALAAGCSFAAYSLLTQQSLNPVGLGAIAPLHPMAFSLVLFSTNLVLATVCLLVSGVNLPTAYWLEIGIMSGVSAIAAMTAYILNNYGIQQIGAAKASLISATTPILTALLALALLQEVILMRQWIGIIGVTLGIASLSLQTKAIWPRANP